MRSIAVRGVRGQLSGLVRALLRVFWNPAEHDMSTAGIGLKLFDDTSVRPWIRYGMYVADADALRGAFAWKGASGLKPCMLCSNVFGGMRDIVAHDALHGP